MRRTCNDRLCVLLSVLLILYIFWRVLTSSNVYVQYQQDRKGELAYKNALENSIPIMENKHLCLLDQLDLILLIISYSSHFLERQSIRESWGSMSDAFGVRSQRLFIVGYEPGKSWYTDLFNEATHEQDLLYLPVSDNSATLKELHAYSWLKQHCPNVIYMFKTEDDLFVNSILLHDLVGELKMNPNKSSSRYLYNISIESLFLAQINADASKFLFGWAFQPGHPERNVTFSPYYVSYKEYPKQLYPRYCSGFGYLMSAKTRDLLVAEGLKVEHPFRFPDIFLTGMLAETLGLSCDTLPFTYHQGTTDQCIELIRNNKKHLPTYSPLLICSTGLHTGQNSYSDYSRLWAALKFIYSDRLNRGSS